MLFSYIINNNNLQLLILYINIFFLFYNKYKNIYINNCNKYTYISSYKLFGFKLNNKLLLIILLLINYLT